MIETPWASFCISTFKRPEFLRTQIASLLGQTFPQFEIVISDNDPDASGKSVTAEFDDPRVKYYHNKENLGMIRSFNKSIDRAAADYLVMVTDDDPVENFFLSEMYDLEKHYPGYAVYAGFIRSHSKHSEVEVISENDFIREILHPQKTPWLLWSSCLLKRAVVMEINRIPDYDSPHLADHALIAMAGSKGGGVIINKKYSFLSSHENNFSKFNFEYYVKGCKGFYYTLLEFCKDRQGREGDRKVILEHLQSWFITNIFSLKRHYSVRNPDSASLERVNECAAQILGFPFMKGVALRYRIKGLIFKTKIIFGLLK